MLQYEVVDNYLERRTPYRDQHLKRAQEAHHRGELLLAGAFAHPTDGAALVFNVDDVSTVERFAQDDPYVKGGVVTAWRVREWAVVVGGT
jgi:uncharacterized protein YciI